MKSLLPCLVLALSFCLTPVAASAAMPPKEDIMHKTQVGDTEVWIIAPAWRDQPANVLLPKTQEQKDAIARAYPNGIMRNAMNVMLVRGKNYLALVDTGLPNTLPGLLTGLKAAGVSPADITHVIITHSHGDHIGGLTTEGKAVFPNARVIFSEKELDYWTNPANKPIAPERAQGIFTQLPQALAPYQGRVDKAKPETDVLPGLHMIPAYGHTPGHVVMLVHSGDSTQRSATNDPLLFWADLMHGMLVQLPHPDVAVTYDVDPEMATAARKALLERAKAEGWRISGVHVPGVAPWPPLK